MKFQNPSMHGSEDMAGIKKCHERMNARIIRNQYAPSTEVGDIKKIKHKRQLWVMSGLLKIKTIFEPQHNKTNEMACAPSEDSDQTVYMNTA